MVCAGPNKSEPTVQSRTASGVMGSGDILGGASRERRAKDGVSLVSLAAVGEQVVLEGGGGRGRHKEASVDLSRRDGDDGQGVGAGSAEHSMGRVLVRGRRVEGLSGRVC